MRTLLCCTLASALLWTPERDVPQSSLKADVVEVCRLQTAPPAYNHKLIDVTGMIEHDFEHFVVSDSQCPEAAEVWLEYGGSTNSDTVYCCGHRAGASRGGTLEVENIKVSLTDDAMFRQFNDYLANGGTYNRVKFRASVRGRFFAGDKRVMPDGREFWMGFGHLGCCSLLVIQQVLAVDSQTPTVAIRLGAAGPVAIGELARDVVSDFPANRRRAIDLRLEGDPTPALELTLARSPVRGGLVAELQRRDGRDEVSRIWIKDPLARTDKGIGVGSTVAELRAAYQVAWVSMGEGRLYMRVAELGASFELDRSGARENQLASVKDPDAVPGDVKIVGVLLTSRN